MNATRRDRQTISATSTYPVEGSAVLTANCPRCGAEVALYDAPLFLDCPYCDSALCIESRGIHWRTVLTPKLRNWDQATLRIEAWANAAHGGRAERAMRQVLQTAAHTEMQYFPLWVLRTETGVHVEPAAITAAPEMWRLDVEEGVVMDTSPPDEDLPMPEVPCQVAVAWAARRGVDTDRIEQIDLFYVPVFVAQCEYEGEPFRVVVDASANRALVDYLPATLGLSWQMIGYLSYGAFIAVGLVSTFLQKLAAVVAFLLSFGLIEVADSLGCGLFDSPCLGSIVPSALLVQVLIGATFWLATVYALTMVFTGRWKLLRL